MPRDSMRLSVVLPVFAEEDSVVQLVGDLHELVGEDLFEVILILASSSPSPTRHVCRDLALRYPRVRVTEQEQGPGLGYAVRQGIREVRGSDILLMDSDGEMDVRTVPEMVARMKRGDVDLVVGSRWMKGGGVEGYGRVKRFLNLGFHRIFRLLYRTRVPDLTLGFKLGRAGVLQSLPFVARFHDVGCETTLRVIRAGYRVAAVPTVWRCRKAGTSNNPFRRNFLYVSMALRILFSS